MFQHNGYFQTTSDNFVYLHAASHTSITGIPLHASPTKGAGERCWIPPLPLAESLFHGDCGCTVLRPYLKPLIVRSPLLGMWNLNLLRRSISVVLLGNCLLDIPRKQIQGPEELPGQTYDATQQCNLTFGPEYSVCPGMDVCARLWCAVVRQGQMVCLTKKLPAVEGTPCGKGRICLQGKCVDKTKKKYYSVSGHPNPWDLAWDVCGYCHRGLLG